ncbi:MFS transporter [Paenibacillus thermotolerans]|uniref:MFS transporter n=1 Tax=Paenibacillus thermotolerans TaxID=3027807 RepID=UPI002368A7B7|nr:MULTISPECIES: MFS transporter [unclassified Paenibacillus]
MQARKQNAVFSPLKDVHYRKLFAGQVLSDFANWLDFLALSSIVVYAFGYGAWALSALSIAIGLPWVVIGPLAGARIGRLPGRTVLIVCDLLRAAIVFSFIWASSLTLLLILVFLKMCVSSVFDPVRQQGIKRLANPSLLAEASSLSQLSVSATKIVAPMLGGLCIAAGGATLTFWIGSGLYLLSAAVFCGLPRWRAADSGSGRKPAQAGGLRQSFAFIAGRKPLLFAIVFMSAAMFLVFLYDGLFVLFTKNLSMGESSRGLLMSAVGAGSVVGSLAAGQWTFWKAKPLAFMSRNGLLSGLLIAVVGAGGYGLLPTGLWLWVPIFALLGACGGFTAVPYGYLLQTETTEETIGPVAALSNALQSGSMLVAPLIGAALSVRLGVGGVFLGAGVAMCLLAALFRLKLSGGGDRLAPSEGVTANQ